MIIYNSISTVFLEDVLHKMLTIDQKRPLRYQVLEYLYETTDGSESIYIG